MSNHQTITLKMKLATMFFDLKTIFVIVLMADLYRNTALAADVFVTKKILYGDAMRWLWQDVASGYVKWIPVVIIGDVIVRWFLEGHQHE